MTHYVNHTAPSALLRAHGFDVSGADSLKKAFWAPRFAFTIAPAVLAQLVALVFPWLAAFRQKVRIAACSVLYRTDVNVSRFGFANGPTNGPTKP